MNDMITAEMIRESRKDGYWGSPGDGYECLEAEQHVDYLLGLLDAYAENAPAEMRLLRAAKQLARAHAATSILDRTVTPETEQALKDLVAAVDELWVGVP